jgi:hypothetical protein
MTTGMKKIIKNELAYQIHNNKSKSIEFMISKLMSFKIINYLLFPMSLEGFNGLIRIVEHVHDLLIVIG